MHRFVSLNLKIHSPDEINLHALSSAALYGRGVFTTVAVYDGKPFLWEKHWQRLTKNAENLRINLSEFSKKSVETAFSELIFQNKIENARARISFFDESASEIWSLQTNQKTSLLITTADFREAKDLHLTASPYQINSKSPLAGVKSCNYLENILALEEAKTRGFDEAVRLNERGEIASACTANLFWIKDGEIRTPALETGCLEGTTRNFIIEAAKDEFEFTETKESLENLLEADEVFLTSAGIGIARVENLDEKSYGGEIIKRLQKIYEKSRTN